MTKKIIYQRWQMPLIKKAMQTRRVLLLSGPRQCGKTTLAKQMVSKNREYRTLDDTTMLQAAQIDPHGFVKHNSQTLIIDEVQRVPTLLPAIKKAVDEDTRSGQYLLTGSANIQSLPGVTESLAGRISRVRKKWCLRKAASLLKFTYCMFLGMVSFKSIGFEHLCMREDRLLPC